MTPPRLPCRTAGLLRELGTLGTARIVLRTCSGLAELVCSTAELRVEPPWAILSTAGASVHVELAALRTAELRGGCAHDDGPPSICFVGQCGSPCLVFVLDRATCDRERAWQRHRFRALRARWGARVCLDSRHAIEGGHWLQ